MHPGLPTCAFCQEWAVEIPSGKVLKRGGIAQKRRGPPPCSGCPKMPDLPAGTIGGPHLAVELSDANQRALDYHRQGAAVHWQGVPSDDLVRRHAAIIEGAEAAVRRAWEQIQASLNLARKEPNGR